MDTRITPEDIGSLVDPGVDLPLAQAQPAQPLAPNSLGLYRLSDICEPLLGMCFHVARDRHRKGTLPVKAFRLNGGRRGPLFVHEDDLAALIARRRKKAVAVAGPVGA